MMKCLRAAVAAAVLGFGIGQAWAQVPTPTPTPTSTPTATPSPLPTVVATNLCQLTGQVIDASGSIAYNEQVYFQTLGVQNASGFIVRGGSNFTVFTDANGNLPASVNLVKKSIVQVTVGNTQPVQFQVPSANCPVDLSTEILANLDPPSVVSANAIGAGGDYQLSVVNPATGSIGTSTLTPGKVTGLQGVPICTTAPTLGQAEVFNGTQWCPGASNPSPFVADGKRVTDGIIGSGSASLSSVTGGFASTDCNVVHGAGCTGTADKMIAVSGAGTLSANLITTIVGFTNTNTVTLAATASTATTAAHVNWGTDNATALAAAYAAAAANVPAASGLFGSTLSLPAGRILTSANVVFNSNFVVVSGQGRAGTILESAGPGDSPLACTSGHHGTIQLFGVHNGIQHIGLLDLDDTADCFVNVSLGGSSEGLLDVILSTDNTTALTTDPVALAVGGITSESFKDLTIGGAPAKVWQSGGFRQAIKTISFVNGVSWYNIGVQPNSRDFAASVFNDANSMVKLTGQGSSFIGGVFEFGPNGLDLGSSSSQTNTVVGSWFGDLTGIPSAWWVPSSTYTNGSSFVVPMSGGPGGTGTTVVGGACASGGNTCQVADITGMYEKQRIVIAGSGAAGAYDWYAISSCGAVGNGSGACTTTTLTLSKNITTTPAGGSFVGFMAYGETVYRAAFQDSAGTCTSGLVQPTWSTIPNAGNSLTDGTCTWVNYGPGAAIYTVGQAVNSYGITGNFISGTPIGILADNNTGSMAISGNEFFNNQVYPIACQGCTGVTLTGNTFSLVSNQPALMHADSLSSVLSYLPGNVIGAAPSPCTLEWPGVTKSFAYGPVSVCGGTTTGTNWFDTNNSVNNSFLDLNLVNVGAATIPMKVVAASAQTADLQDWNNSGGTVLASVDKVGNVQTTGKLTVTNNGHVFSTVGTGTPPGASSGSVTASSTDASFEVTGATVFPLTITLNVACTNAVFPTCVDETTAVAFKVTHPSAQTVVLTGNTNNDSILCNTVCK